MNRKQRRAAALSEAKGAGADRLFAQGAERHGKGDLAAAERLYREALRADSGHAGALHYLGLLAAQHGSMDEAARLIRKALLRRPGDAEALRNLAKVQLTAGQTAAAETTARSAVKAAPGDAQAAIVLGAALSAAGRGPEAEAELRRALDLAPGHPEALNHLGVTLAGEGRQAEAVAAFKAALAAAPGFVEAQVNLAESLLATAALEEAEAAARSAISVAPNHPRLLDLLARTLAAAGRLKEAVAAHKKAVSLDARTPQIAFNLAATLQEAARAGEAEAVYRDLLKQAPAFAAGWANLGALLQQQGRSEEALEALQMAVKHDQAHLEAWINLANGLEQMSRLEAADEALRRALDQAPEHPALKVLAAKLDRRAGRSEAAAERLAGAPPSDAPAAVRQDWLFERGRNLDRIGSLDAAFAAFAEGNAIAAAEGSALLARQGETRRLIASLRECFAPDWTATWSDIPAPARGESPVFLVGFPRSGTTLLHHVLAGHPRLEVMEEVQALDAAREVIEASARGYPQGLAGLSPEVAEAARAAYWQVADNAVPDRQGRRLVDKLPLNLVQLGLAHRLWPHAQIILALRHPCDVCLSAFMQHFDLNDAMANFLTLQDAGDFYDAVMSLLSRYEASLPLELIRLRYEDLLQDFDGEVARLLADLGLEWDEGVRDFVGTARGRGRINTPSYSQVTEGLYTRARYRWERYRAHLDPLLERVSPWVEHFGYGKVAKQP